MHRPESCSLRRCLIDAQSQHDNLSVSVFDRFEVDANEMQHAANGIDVLWRVLPPDKLMYEGSDATSCRFNQPLATSGVLPCLLVIMGSAMTITEVCAIHRALFGPLHFVTF